MMNNETNHLGHELGKGAVMAVGYVAGKSLFGRLLGHPVVMLGAGIAIGYLGFKYRKEITAAVAKASDMGKDMVLNAKENLADLVEESREAEEAKAKE
jgi:5,10-methenyltetrahydromethanopterin hydrogenase